MFLALWEFEVKPGCRKRFLKVYGLEGDWATLFRKDANYQESRLLHDPELPAIFLTLDFWASRRAYESFMATDAAEYEELDAAAKDLTLRERKIGWFEKVEGRDQRTVTRDQPKQNFRAREELRRRIRRST